MRRSLTCSENAHPVEKRVPLDHGPGRARQATGNARTARVTAGTQAKAKIEERHADGACQEGGRQQAGLHFNRFDGIDLLFALSIETSNYAALGDTDRGPGL